LSAGLVASPPRVGWGRELASNRRAAAF